jgi:hypothetical protein
MANVMEIQPVAQVESPSYPSAKTADADALLSKHVPSRWHKAKGLAGAVAVALAANLAGGCGSQARTSAPPPSEAGPSPNPVFTEASDWMRSIYQSPQPPRLMGKIAVPHPKVNEETVMPNRPENVQ